MRAATTTTPSDRAVPRFHFIGGKGGVGKTTCAAAAALDAAAEGLRVLVASTDPAPSLGDALQVRLSSSPRRVPGRTGALWAVEIDAAVCLRRWLTARREGLQKIAVEGTWLDHEDVAKLLRLSLPGIDELAAFLELARLARARGYDLVVVDTAPTGHTLRMMSMPETLAGLAVVFDRMREKQRAMAEALRGAWHAGAEDALVEELAATARELYGLLRDRVRTRVSWVSLPEPMSIEETADAVAALGRSHITVDAIIVNKLTPDPSSPCGHCDARQAFERRALRRLPRVAQVVAVAARDVEPAGLRALSAIAKELRGPWLQGTPRKRARRWKAEIGGRTSRPAELLPEGVRLVLFGGKGGVGKTTCSAAVAVAAAGRWPDRRVLLISTDPAHSLGDVLSAEPSDVPAPVGGAPPNLDVREIDPAKILTRFREHYTESIDRIFDRMAGTGSFDAAHDRSVMKGLIELAPPGLDELAAVLEITDAITSQPPAWHLVVMDTAPTGHALRLLEMPALIQDWARALMAILLKYQGVSRAAEFAEMLLRLSRGVSRLRDLLTSRHEAIFIAVTRAAALPRLETARLLARLAKLRIHVPVIVVNAAGRGACRRCTRAATAERREIRAAARTLASGRLLVVTGLQIPPPATGAELRRWGNAAWFASPRYHQGP